MIKTRIFNFLLYGTITTLRHKARLWNWLWHISHARNQRLSLAIHRLIRQYSIWNSIMKTATFALTVFAVRIEARHISGQRKSLQKNYLLNPNYHVCSLSSARSKDFPTARKKPTITVWVKMLTSARKVDTIVRGQFRGCCYLRCQHIQVSKTVSRLWPINPKVSQPSVSIHIAGWHCLIYKCLLDWQTACSTLTSWKNVPTTSKVVDKYLLFIEPANKILSSMVIFQPNNNDDCYYQHQHPSLFPTTTCIRRNGTSACKMPYVTIHPLLQEMVHVHPTTRTATRCHACYRSFTNSEAILEGDTACLSEQIGCVKSWRIGSTPIH